MVPNSMNHSTKLRFLNLLWLCAGFLIPVQAEEPTITVQSHAPNILSYDQSPAAYFCIQDHDAPTSTLIIISADGLIERLNITSTGHFQLVAQGYLPDPTYSLIGKITIANKEHLAFFDRNGLQYMVWPNVLTNTPSTLSFAPVITTLKQTLRLAQPRSYAFQKFINPSDHKKSLLMLPQLQHMSVFSSVDNGVTWETQKPLPVPIAHSSTIPLTTAGHSAQPWQSQIQMASPTLSDLNADGQFDMVTQQGGKWIFSIGNGSHEPRLMTLDTSLFRNESDARSGQGIMDNFPIKTNFVYGDVQGKKYCDLIINYGRDLWVYPGTEHGPQLEKSFRYHWDHIIDDINLCDLDSDGREDLLTMNLKLPSIGQLALSLVAPINIAIQVHGYRSLESGFEQTPTWKQTLIIQLPSILMTGKRFTELSIEIQKIEEKLFVVSEPHQNQVCVYAPFSNELMLHPEKESSGAPSGFRELMKRYIFDVADPVLDIFEITKKIPEFINAAITLNVDRETITNKKTLSTQKDRVVSDVMLINVSKNAVPLGLVVGSTPTKPWFVEAIPLLGDQ
jgi:hypothetical protein